MRILFMGTPDFAIPCLSMLLQEKYDIPLVVTQPDKKRGRGHKLAPTPVKEFALENGLLVAQPETLKNEAFLETLREVDPDLIVVVAYGKILPSYIIQYPKYGCVNVHGSLLPKLRGAAPIQWSIINGDKQTGITTMLMDEGLDTGDILLRSPVEIEETDTAGTLFEKMKKAGALTLRTTLQKIKDGKAVRIRQTEEEATYAPMILKQDAKIDWSLPALSIYNRIRGMNPAPGAYSFFQGKKVKILSAQVGEETTDQDYGKVWGYFEDRGIGVVCGGQILYITRLQMENSREMCVHEWIKGHRIEPGDLFTDQT